MTEAILRYRSDSFMRPCVDRITPKFDDDNANGSLRFASLKTVHVTEQAHSPVGCNNVP